LIRDGSDTFSKKIDINPASNSISPPDQPDDQTSLLIKNNNNNRLSPTFIIPNGKEQTITLIPSSIT